jgi:peptidyl-prolyl cis-trans isomerase A (cyclophilin A)
MCFRTKMFIALVFCLGLVQACGGEPNQGAELDDTNTGVVDPLDIQSSGDAPAQSIEVQVETSLGTFVIRLNSDAAPSTVANFLSYVDEGFYDGADGLGATTFHRVIHGFMVQGGGITLEGTKKSTHAAIDHESPNSLLNLRGMVAMARTNAPDSATSQFFVNHVDNPFLDYESENNPGYLVFGEVISGMDVVDAIADVPTGENDLPLTPVLIDSMSRISNKGTAF